MAIEIGINPNSWTLDDVAALRHFTRLAEGAGFVLTDRRTRKAG